MAEFDLGDLEKINKSEEVLDFLVANGIIKEKKFREQLAYEKELSKLQFELLRLQQYIVENKKRLLLIFEGRDAAGKGGAISRMIAKLNPKKVRVVALPKPTEEEGGQWYFQRYIKQLPNRGEMVFFDRSWYNRAVVEPVFGFCSDAQYALFMKQVNSVEQLLLDDDILIMKFFLTISKEEQQERLEDRRKDPMKRWKVGDLDEKAQEKWDDYTHYIDKMLKKSGTEKLPWIEVRTDNKKEARLEVIKYALSHVAGFSDKQLPEVNKDLIKIHK
ncbi:polyphosphate kinase 2 [Olivibacter sp. CPCC 100613]|uniref:polyphosphate kinase 2 n=1 Tax=Olivibacter sp. CPCC 100613 TaxID=3079931 RepID=UPI002FF4E56A